MEVNTKLLESPFKQERNLLTPLSYAGWGSIDTTTEAVMEKQLN